MKKALMFLFLFATAAVAFLAAQESEKTNESELYPKHIYIARIWSHKLGYRIDYFRDDRSIGTIYAPIKWFRNAGGFGHLGYGVGDQVPYMTVFYKEGKVHHFRVMVFQDVTHITWGTVSSSDNWDDRFDAEEPVFEYFAPKAGK